MVGDLILTNKILSNIISLSCHEQVNLLKLTCSWHDKLIILWILNRQAKISLCKILSKLIFYLIEALLDIH